MLSSGEVFSSTTTALELGPQDEFELELAEVLMDLLPPQTSKRQSKQYHSRSDRLAGILFWIDCRLFVAKEV